MDTDFQVNVEDITTQAFNGIIEWQYMHPFTVFDVMTRVNVTQVTELHTEVVSGNLSIVNAGVKFVRT